jgi:hypothetical protein
MLDSVAVKKKKVEDPGGKLDARPPGDETSRRDKGRKLHVNLKR